MLISILLHHIVPLLERVVLGADLMRWVYYFDFDLECLLRAKLLGRVILECALLNELLC